MANIFSRVKAAAKRVGRKTAALHTKLNRVVTPVASAAASYFVGPVGGAAVTALGSTAGYYFAATDARSRGIQGRDARAFGRKERKRDVIYGAAGLGVGTLAAGLTGGLGAALTGTYGQSVTGLGSGQGAFGLSNPFISNPVTSVPLNLTSEATAFNPYTGQALTQQQVLASQASGGNALAYNPYTGQALSTAEIQHAQSLGIATSAATTAAEGASLGSLATKALGFGQAALTAANKPSAQPTSGGGWQFPWGTGLPAIPGGGGGGDTGGFDLPGGPSFANAPGTSDNGPLLVALGVAAVLALS